MTKIGWDIRQVRQCAVRVICEHVFSRLSVKLSIHSGRSRKRSSESRLPSLFLFGFCIFQVASSFLKLVRHFAIGLDLLETNPAMSMLKTNCYQNWQTTREQQEVRNCPFACDCLLLFGQPWFLTVHVLNGSIKSISNRPDSMRVVRTSVCGLTGFLFMMRFVFSLDVKTLRNPQPYGE